MIYIQEAHPSDLWQLPVNVKDEVVYESPTNFEQRSGIASACVRKLGLRIPALIDHLEDATEEAYTGWPDRLYLIDRDGQVAYKSRPGPFGFHPDELESALREVVEPLASVGKRLKDDEFAANLSR